MLERCPYCHFWFEREEGYFIGATAVNLVAAETVPVIVFITVAASTWPAVNWTLLEALCLALAILVPLALFPFARALWLAIDLVIRPIQPQEFERRHGLE